TPGHDTFRKQGANSYSKVARVNTMAVAEVSDARVPQKNNDSGNLIDQVSNDDFQTYNKGKKVADLFEKDFPRISIDHKVATKFDLAAFASRSDLSADEKVMVDFVWKNFDNLRGLTFTSYPNAKGITVSDLQVMAQIAHVDKRQELVDNTAWNSALIA